MPILTVADAFTLRALEFDLTALYGRGFQALDSGTRSNFRSETFVMVNRGSHTIQNWDVTFANPDGTHTVAHVVRNYGGSYAGTFDRTEITSIAEYYGDQLRYTITDVIDPTNRASTVYTTQGFYDRVNEITTGSRDDYIIGGTGIDDIVAGDGMNYVAAGAGDDAVRGGSHADHLDGGEGNDTLDGGAGNDYLAGGQGNDTLYGGWGADILNGGEGFDTALFYAPVFVHLGAPELNTGDAAGDVFLSIEALVGSSGNDVLIGDNGNNSIASGNGEDVLYGLDGNDVLSAWGDGDKLYGGAGNDRLIGSSFTLMEGGDGDDVLSGGHGSILRGGAGNDTLSGPFGFKILEGGTGADQLVGGRGFDWATYENATEAVRVSLSGAVANTGEAAGDTFSSIDGVRGSRFDDVLIGATDTAIFDGGDGDDTIVSRAGGSLYGGRGNDTYFVSTASAAVVEDQDQGYDRIYSSVSYVLPDNVEALNLQDTAVTGIGNALDNGIGGNSLNNVLSGGAGNDLLFGFGGKDTFVFRSGYGHDVIGDFEGAGIADADVVQIDPVLADSFAKLMSFASQSGADVVFAFDAGTSLTLQNVNLALLHQSDFLFV
ncbi:hypothetical protein B6S44_19550 [Bosea sp. Tri-44]|uniref:calcium-binding protein n=1 Tax=Bosea sp. Tri-44 TaxID=1972137 RepID=UPI00100FA4C5|nr:calcium-binding protein [Bosea sp. Tri-44]RXT52937.1 hypothetical protein B6S44_19550 [Bosea sp. Tri-44]